MSLYLGIETSNPSAWTPEASWRPGVAAARAAGAALEVLGQEPIALRANEDDLVPAIDRLFRRLGLPPRELTHVAVSVGPGGYTAVRLAVAAAKMIAEATGAQCLPVPTSWVVAHRVASDVGRFAVALASKGESAFVTVFDEGRSPDGGRLLDAGGVAGLDVEVFVADRFLPAAMRAAAESRGIRVQPPVFDPAACLEAAGLPGSGTRPVDPAALLPLYPREPEAVTKWRQLHPPA